MEDLSICKFKPEDKDYFRLVGRVFRESDCALSFDVVSFKLGNQISKRRLTAVLTALEKYGVISKVCERTVRWYVFNKNGEEMQKEATTTDGR